MGRNGIALVKRKRLKINEEFCKGCGLCILFCPNKSLQFKKGFNSKGFHPVILKGKCNFCAKCYIVCPDCAIEIEELEDKK
jgi:2-oxoglutarate ferredoxin oxidoreductase subunit delta